MKKIVSFIKKNIFLFGLFSYASLIFFVNYRINAFRYDNFDYGKFDLGNMAQMLWNTLNGRFLYLTNYFGANMPRWGMSHVDPILVLFLPVFAIWTSPFTLIVSQLLLFIGSAFIVYKIAELKLESKISGFLWGVIFLVYPAVGFITAWTAFHGVSVAVPFFLGAFYIFEKAYIQGGLSKKQKILFWVLLIITMSGKEQIPLYIGLYALFIFLYRSGDLFNLQAKFLSKDWLKKLVQIPNVKLSISMMIVSVVWFVTAFFIIIPHNAHYRAAGYEKFIASLNLEGTETRDVDLPNYFLARYDAFGDSYSEVLINMITQPKKLIKVFFGGDRIENLNMTFRPLAYFPLLHPPTLLLSAGDFLINYGTSAGGIGTAEISNHRISMIIPVMIISSIYGVSFVAESVKKHIKKSRITPIQISIGVSILILVVNLKCTYTYNNPVYMWLSQAISKRLPILNVFADEDLKYHSDMKVGEVIRLSELENKDRQCAEKIVSMIPDGVSVSGPDYLGAHLSLRETYAIYPALYLEADYVIVDVFSRKILTILDVDVDLSRDVVEKLLISNEHSLEYGCGNLFVFKKVPFYEKETILPVQEAYEYDHVVDYDFFQSVSIVDYEFPEVFSKGEEVALSFTYIENDKNSLGEYVLFTTLVNKETESKYQFANLPSFAIWQPSEWKEDRYYTEKVRLTFPAFLESGEYDLFIGMGNKIRTRSMYLGTIELL